MAKPMETNVIFRDESGDATDAQLLAFEDTWPWRPPARDSHGAVMRRIRRPVVLHT